MTTTKIEWADLTINPVVGCSKCSPGCENCYAERFAARLAKNPATAPKYAGVVDERGKWTGKPNFDVSCLVSLPKPPKRIFVGSMCDMFHENVGYEALAHIMGHLALTHSNAHHTFLILTKRVDRMLDFFSNWKPHRRMSNLWLGVTVCNQAEADAKIPVLLQTPAAKRFVSVEPMLGPVDLTAIDYPSGRMDGAPESGMLDALRGLTMDDNPMLPALDWVICGGETGPKARPMHPDWARSLRDQCQAAGVPFFFKGWGEWTADYTYDDAIRTPGAYVADTPFARVGKKRSGRLLDGREWNEVPS